ncbi:MAG TPA: PEGA domain-containing protein, partial [Steroidobacteraceae bacterium]
MNSSVAYAQVRVREPLGERILGESVSVGGSDSDIVVPGVAPGCALTINRRKGVWVVEAKEATVRANGRLVTAPRDLRKGDTLALGEAQIVVTDASRTLLRVDIHHLVGNATVAPASTVATLIVGGEGDADVEIQPLASLRITPLATAARPSASARPANPRRWVFAALAVVALAVVSIVTTLLEPVLVDVTPGDAHVLTPGTLVAIHNPGRLLLLPGKHVIRAERDGYVAAQAAIEVQSEDTNRVRLRLEKLPGKLDVDTNGIAATVSVDGVEIGHAPSVLSVPAGDRTIMISAPRYVDYITNLAIAGAGERQTLKATLQTSWGSLKVLSNPEGAHVSIDGVEGGATPVTIPAPSGVRRIQITTPGRKTWESSVVLKAGETLSVGPVTLGQPDAHLVLRSEPAGADATVAGTHLGRTPVEIDLPAGIAHQIVLSAPGFKNWIQAVFAEPGRKLAVLARLQPILARVSVQGEPGGAEVLVDGVARGKSPRSLELPATEHRVEVRKEGFQPFRSFVTPEAGLDRTVQ